MPAALQALVASAHLLGVDPKIPIPAAAPRLVAAAPETVLSRLALADAAAAQQGAWRAAALGLGKAEFRAAFDASGLLWIELRQGGALAARSADELEKGVELELPAGRVRLRLRSGLLTAEPLSPLPGPSARLRVLDLVDALYGAARKVCFPAVEYAVAYEDGSAAPASVSLLRRDQDGRYYVSYHSTGELAQTTWLVAVDGALYGARLEGARLVFVSKPLPPVLR